MKKATTNSLAKGVTLPSQPITQGNVVTQSSSTVRVMNAGVADVRAIAAFLLHLAANEEEPDFLTHLRLQKLMYYVQGWSLALRGRPAFDARIEAWAHGPVVKELYNFLARFGNSPIMPNAIEGSHELSREDQEFVASVWQAYKGFSASALREMTHKEYPWMKARGTSGPADRSDAEITQDDLLAFFSRQAK